eukprot:g77241.t1
MMPRAIIKLLPANRNRACSEASLGFDAGISPGDLRFLNPNSKISLIKKGSRRISVQIVSPLQKCFLGSGDELRVYCSDRCQGDQVSLNQTICGQHTRVSEASRDPNDSGPSLELDSSPARAPARHSEPTFIFEP